jgi:uncharacterized protein YebE (UPF0316 family)
MGEFMIEIGILITYFIVGVINYIGWTLWYITIESRRTILAGVVSAALTMLDYSVLAYMILSLNFMPRLIAFSLGTMIGTILTMSIRYNNDWYISRFFQKIFRR